MAAYFEQVLGGTYDNHVLPFLWLKGEARETITEYLEQIAGADIREVCLESRTHPDFLGMQVVATALGGYFGSRLMQNLREEHGYTYGVVSAMVNFEREGYFAIAAQVGADVTQEALREIYAEIERLGAEPMPEAELELVKNMMTGEMMRILDGPFGIADVTIENILCGCDNTVIGSNIRRIREMTPAGVQQLARKYLRREDLVTVVAGAEKPAGM